MFRDLITSSTIISTTLAVNLAISTVVSAEGRPQCLAERKAANLEFTLQDMHGNPVRLKDYLGQVILLDFWATWCAPCRIEIPGFIEMYDQYRSQGFSVLGISVDDPVDALQSYAAELGMNYPVLVGSGRDDVMEAYGPLLGFPTSYIIDRDGVICFKHTGFAPRDKFEQEILSLL